MCCAYELLSNDLGGVKVVDHLTALKAARNTAGATPSPCSSWLTELAYSALLCVRVVGQTHSLTVTACGRDRDQMRIMIQESNIKMPRRITR